LLFPASNNNGQPNGQPKLGRFPFIFLFDPTYDGPRLSKEFLADEKRELGAMRYSEEYELAWLEPDESVFMTVLIDRAFTTEVRPLWQ
jgi:hypothetical protein